MLIWSLLFVTINIVHSIFFVGEFLVIFFVLCINLSKKQMTKRVRHRMNNERNPTLYPPWQGIFVWCDVQEYEYNLDGC